MSYTGSISDSSGSNNKDYRMEVLELNNVLVWEVSSNNSRKYMLSLQGYSDDNCIERVMLCDGVRESLVINAYQRNGYNLSCCSASCRMSDKEQENYNKALFARDYEHCIEELFLLEICLNRRFGYQIKGKVKKKSRYK